MKRVLFLCFVLAVLLRVYSVFPFNTVIGFDQARDLFDAHTMVQTLHPRIIGPTAGNNPDLHHGIAFIYYLALPIATLGPNPMNAVYFNIAIQSFLVFILAYFSWELFKNKSATIITAILTAVSYHLTQYAGWLSNPTVTLVTVPVFYLSLWKYRHNRYWLILAALALGASIQFELFFIYLIPASLIYWGVFRPRLPSIKILVLSILAFMVTTSTMIATELKFSFSGVKAILFAGSKVGGSLSFVERLQLFSAQLGEQFALFLIPFLLPTIIIIACAFIYLATSDKKLRESQRFLFLYLLSPTLMLLLGAHNAPWFLIGLPPAIIILYGYFFTRMKLVGYAVTLLIVLVSVVKVSIGHENGQQLLSPDNSAILSRQIAAIDYTYKQAKGESFAIDTVTNPLYVNAVWGYHYMWYGQSRYGYRPTWLGGDQLPPYNTLEKSNKSEMTSFVIMDMTDRIPEPYRVKAVKSRAEEAPLVGEKQFGEVSVLKFERN